MKTVKGGNGVPDPWEGPLYAFEGSWPEFNRGTLTLAECRQVHKAACEAYNVKPIPIRQHEGREITYYFVDPTKSGSEYISFRLDHKNPAVVLHETAHHICTKLYSWWIQDHGKTFQGVYFWLLARAEIAPVEALRASARKFGLAWREIKPR